MKKEHWMGVLFAVVLLDFVFLAAIIWTFAEKLIT